MKTRFFLAAALSVLLLACARVPDAPRPGEPGYAVCSDCAELILNPDFRVVPSHDGLVSVWHVRKRKCVLKDVCPNWDKFVTERSSLILVQGADGRYGFFDGRTGACPIPLVHRHAWPLSEGRCAVEDNDVVRFLDERGHAVAGLPTFPYYGHPLDDFVFRHGLCAVPDTSFLCGVIDTTGRWFLEPKYKDIVFLDDCILATLPGRRIQFGFDGSVLNPFVVDNVYPLLFHDRQLEVFAFEVDERYGLMDRAGNPLTEAVYLSIEPVSPALFRASLDEEGPGYDLLDLQGRITR